MTDKESTGAEEITWDLSDLYAGMDDPQLNADLDACDTEADALGEAYRARIVKLDPAADEFTSWQLPADAVPQGLALAENGGSVVGRPIPCRTGAPGAGR